MSGRVHMDPTATLYWAPSASNGIQQNVLDKSLTKATYWRWKLITQRSRRARKGHNKAAAIGSSKHILAQLLNKSPQEFNQECNLAKTTSWKTNYPAHWSVPQTIVFRDVGPRRRIFRPLIYFFHSRTHVFSAVIIFLSFADSCGPFWTQCGLVVGLVP